MSLIRAIFPHRPQCKLRKAEAGLEQNPLRRQQLEKQIDEEFKARCVREYYFLSGGVFVS